MTYPWQNKEITSFSDFIRTTLDAYETLRGHKPDNLYLDYYWLRAIQEDKNFFDIDPLITPSFLSDPSIYSEGVGGDFEQECHLLDDVPATIVKDMFAYWRKSNLSTGGTFLYISNTIMDEKQFLLAIEDTLRNLKSNIISSTHG